jgi:FKBP-type peptidyl-prolyl cis-trans isomerase 2
MKKNQYYILASVILLVFILITGCGSPAQAKTGDTVKVQYTGKFADGTVFDTSVGGEPLEFTLGQGKVIAGFEQAVIDMRVGESKTVAIPADQAYGQRNDDLIIEVGRDRLSPDIVPEVGMQLNTIQSDGSVLTVTIIEVSETTVKIDANHPLAGQDLTFDIELMEIGSSQSQESNLTSIPLEEALTSGKPTIAEFGSSTCIPCKQMKPILEELAAEYDGKSNVVIIEVYEQRELTQQYGIMAIPTQVVFDSSGQEVTRHVGFWAKEDIIAQLDQIGLE